MLTLVQHLKSSFIPLGETPSIPIRAYRRQAQEGVLRCGF